MTGRTPRELIELYWAEVWNNRRTEMIRELCADPIVRHDPGSVTSLSIEDQIARVRQQSEEREPYFEHEVLCADDTFVTSVWNMHTRKGEKIELCGIEVFKAVDGKFTDCWNSSYVAGRWGREGDASVAAALPEPPIIAAIEQITNEWVQAMLQHAGVPAPRVSLLHKAPIGHGNLSQAIRTRITYNANASDALPSVVCKITSALPEAVDMAGASGVYARECAVYDFLGETPPLAVPRAYWRKVSDNGRAINLILEDLTDRTRAGDQIAGCTIAEAEAVAHELAKLHGATWGDPRLAEAGWLFHRASGADAAAAAYALAAAEFRRRFAGRAAPELLDAVDAATTLVGPAIIASGEGEALLHGEPRVDNVLFEDTADRIKAWLIDWQFADIGTPMLDLSYFLAGSLEPDDRRTCEGNLIARHAATVGATVAGYGEERARREYRDVLPIALQFTVGAAMAMPPGEHADRLLLTLAERNVAAMRDWDLV